MWITSFSVGGAVGPLAGGALGIALLGSLVTAVYRGQVADTVPAGVPG